MHFDLPLPDRNPYRSLYSHLVCGILGEVHMVINQKQQYAIGSRLWVYAVLPALILTFEAF